jgi:hypothetical protein
MLEGWRVQGAKEGGGGASSIKLDTSNTLHGDGCYSFKSDSVRKGILLQ